MIIRVDIACAIVLPPSHPTHARPLHQTFTECFGVLGVLDTLHRTNKGFLAALRLGHGTTLGVSRKEVAAAVKASTPPGGLGSSSSGKKGE